ncbi:MarR family transcriptional regulator [Rhizobium sp. FY34]|uniref:MarR family winged helix-turn-helix transcriptional regulator n=1 Tax=Rhizobium sp. FY34 TaxID=2562309 RepID=UPI0010C0EE56|nr:MarR family transcriptional regulator [Rhizobium sp. FY34]
MSRHTVIERLFDEMTAFSRRLRSYFDLKSEETGLTLTRARVLFALSRRGSLNQRDLAQEMEIETPTLVRILDGMEKQQLIERRTDDSDRRAKEIHMTKEGDAACIKAQAFAHGVRMELVAGISQEDLAVSLRVLTQLNRNLLAIGQGRAAHA